MIGLIDSGEGGVVTAEEIRSLSPNLDLTLLLDKKHAPYGKKTREELVELTRSNIERLVSLGASRVLLACCTASTVWENLPDEDRKISIPILAPTAKRAVSVSQSGRIAVIATEATVRSGKWTELLTPLSTKELAAPELVALTEGGACDENADEKLKTKIFEILTPLATHGADTLVLGCTHFPRLAKTVKETVKNFGIKYIVSSAKEGARELMRTLGTNVTGHGQTVIIN